MSRVAKATVVQGRQTGGGGWEIQTGVCMGKAFQGYGCSRGELEALRSNGFHSLSLMFLWQAGSSREKDGFEDFRILESRILCLKN